MPNISFWLTIVQILKIIPFNADYIVIFKLHDMWIFTLILISYTVLMLLLKMLFFGLIHIINSWFTGVKNNIATRWPSYVTGFTTHTSCILTAIGHIILLRITINYIHKHYTISKTNHNKLLHKRALDILHNPSKSSKWLLTDNRAYGITQ